MKYGVGTKNYGLMDSSLMQWFFSWWCNICLWKLWKVCWLSATAPVQ